MNQRLLSVVLAGLFGMGSLAPAAASAQTYIRFGTGPYGSRAGIVYRSPGVRVGVSYRSPNYYRPGYYYPAPYYGPGYYGPAYYGPTYYAPASGWVVVGGWWGTYDRWGHFQRHHRWHR
jgi:hypothetical protein